MEASQKGQPHGMKTLFFHIAWSVKENFRFAGWFGEEEEKFYIRTTMTRVVWM